MSRLRTGAAVSAVALAAAVALSGCASMEARPKVGECSPSYTVSSAYGKFSIQQAKANASVQWGMYPSAGYSGTRYTALVYVGNKKVDSKNQSYPPHGSVPASTVTGKHDSTFGVTGTVYQGSKEVLVYTIQCYLK